MFAPHAPPRDWLERYPYDAVLAPGHLVNEGEDAMAMPPLSPTAYLNLSGVRAPTTIITGRHDMVARHERQADLLPFALPHAELHGIEGVGHMLHHTASETVRRHIEAQHQGAL